MGSEEGQIKRAEIYHIMLFLGSRNLDFLKYTKPFKHFRIPRSEKAYLSKSYYRYDYNSKKPVWRS